MSSLSQLTIFLNKFNNILLGYFNLFNLRCRIDYLFSFSRTPEDLTAIGIKKPHHRKKLTAEIVKLDIPDCLPSTLPHSIDELISGLRLHQYLPALR